MAKKRIFVTLRVVATFRACSRDSEGHRQVDNSLAARESGGHDFNKMEPSLFRAIQLGYCSSGKRRASGYAGSKQDVGMHRPMVVPVCS